MPQTVLDAMDNAAAWTALQSDGVTPSAEIAMATDTTHVRFGADGKSGRISATVSAQSHVLRRALPNVDLSGADDIRWWVWSTRAADGSAARPFFLELRLASAAMGLADPANKWLRLMPVEQPNDWCLVRFDITDLPAPVRSAANLMQLRCADASAPSVCYLDDVLAVREDMLGDADAALLARLDKKLALGGTAVPAVFNLPENAGAPARPFIRITQYDVEFADDRTPSTSVRSDYTGAGFRLRPAGFAYYVYYEIEVLTDTRANQALVYDFVLRSLPPRGDLLVNGVPLPLDQIIVEALDVFGRRITDRTLLHYRVSTRLAPTSSTPATPPFNQIIVETDTKAPA